MVNTRNGHDSVLAAFERAGRRRAMAMRGARAMGWAVLVIVVGFLQLQVWLGVFLGLCAAVTAGVGTFVGVFLRRSPT